MPGVYKILRFMAVLLSLLCGCASVGEHDGIKGVAVWDIENLSPGSSAASDFGTALSGEIIQTLKQLDEIKVVERQKLVSVMEELNLGSSKLADESTGLRLGRIVGAREMVFGGYMVIGNIMQLDLRRVDVETGRIVKTSRKTAPAQAIDGWLLSAREAAKELYDIGK